MKYETLKIKYARQASRNLFKLRNKALKRLERREDKGLSASLVKEAEETWREIKAIIKSKSDARIAESIQNGFR